MFRRMTFCLVAAASLAACGFTGGGVASPGSTPPDAGTPAQLPNAPTSTAANAIETAFKALDAAATAADVLVDVGAVKPGTPTALRIADGLDKTRFWLNAASGAQRLGDIVSYSAAANQATVALADVRQAFLTAKAAPR